MSDNKGYFKLFAATYLKPTSEAASTATLCNMQYQNCIVTAATMAPTILCKTVTTLYSDDNNNEAWYQHSTKNTEVALTATLCKININNNNTS